VYPYALKTQESGVQVSYGASRRVVSKKSIVDPFVADLQLGTKEAYISRAVEAHDALSVTMGYRTVGGKYKTHVVKSSPFVTVVYDNATPEITAELMQINSVEAREVKVITTIIIIPLIITIKTIIATIIAITTTITTITITYHRTRPEYSTS
jgi:hypothetical protein